MAEAPKKELNLERLYVWELPVRLTHWVIFFAIVILAATGYYIGNPFISVPGAATSHFVMGTVRAVHLYTAIIFAMAVLVRIYWLFVGNSYARLSQFIPMSRQRLQNLWRTLLYYSFIRHDPDDYPGHNALGAGSYAMIFAVYLIMIATGLALYTAIASAGSPFQVFDFLVPLFDGLQMARLIHHIGMWVVLVFVIMHIYFVFLSSIVEHIGTFDSIFSGYKFVPRRRTGTS